VLAGTVELFQARAQESGTTLTWAIRGDIPEFAQYDATRTRQCLANLVSNAVKFTKGGAVSVTLSAEPMGDAWMIRAEVRDNGIGIAPEVQARLFTPFEQASTQTVQDYGGTGLGLAISRRLARVMGGDISVTSQLGAGAMFTFTFRAEKAGPPKAAARGQLQDAATFLVGRHILVVDDSKINRRVAVGLLKPLGCRCSEAKDGATALQMLQEGGIDLVLLDLHMPVMDGMRTLQALRALPGAVAQTPVIILTADVLTSRREDYLGMGFQGYLTKPLRREALLEELQALETAATG
jgi:CheY-like chemotaxis protein